MIYLILLFSQMSVAQDVCHTNIYNEMADNFQNMFQPIIDSFQKEQSLASYFHDNCNAKIKYSYPKLTKLSHEKKYYECQDKSISFDQPESDGVAGWNGYCGEVAIANTIAMSCDKILPPDGHLHTLTSDNSPGTKPSSMIHAMNQLSKKYSCHKRWEYFNQANSSLEFIESIVDGLESKSKFIRTRNDGSQISRSPVPVLIKTPNSKILHWVTVVDIEGYDHKKYLFNKNKECFAYVNQHNSQYKIPCKDLAKLSENVGNLASGLMDNIVGKYVRIK